MNRINLLQLYEQKFKWNWEIKRKFNCMLHCSKPNFASGYVEGNIESTVEEVINKWNQEFVRKGISDPLESIQCILAQALGTRKISDVLRNKQRILSFSKLEMIEKMSRKRLQKMPVQYIIREWDFRDLTLKMRRPVFIPRPETETLVDIVLKEIDSKGTERALELCCGSGAISLALLKARPKLFMIAIDKSKAACQLTKENADLNQLSARIKIIKAEILRDFIIGNIKEKFDVVVANPPYIPSGDLPNLEPEILLYEDLTALDGGCDGLFIIKLILEVCAKLLKRAGKVYLEVDPAHPSLLKNWIEGEKSLELELLNVIKDIYGKERFVEIIKN